jgi:peroxiredoxin
VSRDGVEVLEKFAARRGIGITLLADPDSTAIDAFGVRDDRYGPGSYGEGIAVPSVFVVAPDGIVQHRWLDIDHYDAAPVDAVYTAISRPSS